MFFKKNSLNYSDASTFLTHRPSTPGSFFFFFLGRDLLLTFLDYQIKLFQHQTRGTACSPFTPRRSPHLPRWRKHTAGKMATGSSCLSGACLLASAVLDCCADVSSSCTTKFGTRPKLQPSFALATPATCIPPHCLMRFAPGWHLPLTHTSC